MSETSKIDPSPQGRTVFRSFLISSAISAAIALLGVAVIPLQGIIIAPYGILQLVWTFPLYFYYENRDRSGEAKGVLLSCSFNFLVSVACWGITLKMVSFG